MESLRNKPIERPKLRRWFEPAVGLDIDSMPPPTGQAEGEKDAREEHATIDAEFSTAIAGIAAEAQRLDSNVSPSESDNLGAALKDLSTMAEKIRKSWRSRRSSSGNPSDRL